MSAAPRIAYILKRYPRYSETFVVNEILALEEAGLDVEIYSLRYPEDGHFQDSISRVRAKVTYHAAIARRAADLWARVRDASREIPDIWSRLEMGRDADPRHVFQALSIATQLRRAGITRMHAHFATEASTVARMASHFSGVPFSFTAHAKDIFHESVDSDRLRTLMRDAAGVVTVSDFNLRHLSELIHPEQAEIRRVYNGLDLSRFCFHSPERRSRRIVAVGRLVEKKGFAHLVDACAEMRAAGDFTRCEIIGAGPLEPELRTRIDELGLGDRVQLVGPLPQAEVVKRLQSASVCAVPCVLGSDGNRDGLPTILLEAMALGTPCVSTDVTGIPEVLQDGETGLAVGQGDARGLAGALLQLLDDAPLRVRLAIRARRLMEESFDVSKNAASLRKLLEAPAAEKALTRYEAAQ
jgi:glycosyltransferase involved in cell wall biosynthesis